MRLFVITAEILFFCEKLLDKWKWMCYNKNTV